MDNILFVPATHETQWIQEVLPGISPAELPVAGRRAIDYAIERAQKFDVMFTEILDWCFSQRLADDFADMTRTGVPVFYMNGEGPTPRGLRDLEGYSSPLIGLGVGAFVMFVVGRNYHYLIQNFPEAGGAYGYVRHVCGVDHGYICGWFLILTYVAIAWANTTTLALVSRHLLGGLFSFGFRYEISGYNVYAGEVLLSVAALLLVCGVFLQGRRLAARVQAAAS